MVIYPLKREEITRETFDQPRAAVMPPLRWLQGDGSLAFDGKWDRGAIIAFRGLAFLRCFGGIDQRRRRFAACSSIAGSTVTGTASSRAEAFSAVSVEAAAFKARRC